MAQSYYDCRKQSERSAIINLLTDNDLLSCKITLDALYLTPGLMTPLLRSRIVRTQLRPTEFVELDSAQFKHGRHQTRQNQYNSLQGLSLDKPWHKAGLCTLIEVKRTRCDALMYKTRSYYVCNAPVSCQSQANNLYEAIRGHWGVEEMHCKRDVILSEDAFRSLKTSVQKVMATVSPMAVCLLSGQNKSMSALIDLFLDKIKELFQF
ncbi:transposase family protein [Runella aurantiaca]|uniref:Transposase family protein n=1 Tax=Runella aurantiaca TaxID=2282308 RepID=A0A369I184_9BACT|nr:transposase family protein [Runella aurantiaca]